MKNKKTIVNPSEFRDEKFKLLDATHIEGKDFVLNEDIAKKYHVKTIETKEGEEQHLVKNLNINFKRVFAFAQATFFLAFSSAAGYAAVTTPKDELKEMMRTPHISEQEEQITVDEFFKDLQKNMDEHRRIVEEKRAKEKEELKNYYDNLFKSIEEAKSNKTKTK